MTHAQRLEDMAFLIGSESEKSGAEMIQNLDGQAREQLAMLQQQWIKHTVTLLDRISDWDATKKDRSDGHNADAHKRNQESLSEIGAITKPFAQQLSKVETA